MGIEEKFLEKAKIECVCCSETYCTENAEGCVKGLVNCDLYKWHYVEDLGFVCPSCIFHLFNHFRSYGSGRNTEIRGN